MYCIRFIYDDDNNDNDEGDNDDDDYDDDDATTTTFDRYKTSTIPSLIITLNFIH